MMKIRDTEIFRLTGRNRLVASIAGAALVAGIGGVLIGRSMDDGPAAVEAAEEGEGEEHGPEGFIPMTAERLAFGGSLDRGLRKYLAREGA